MKWNIDKVILEAVKYSYKNEFRKNSPAYQWAIKNAKYDIRIWGHFLAKKRDSKYNLDVVISIAKKYTTRLEFQKSEDRGVYQWCYNNNHLKNKDIFGHMIKHKPNRSKWNIENTKAEAKKYASRKEFEMGSGGAYTWARRNNNLDEVCQHMQKNFIEWDIDLVTKVAKRHKSRGKFIADNSGAYGWIIRNGHKDNIDIFGHMEESVRWNLKKVIKVATLYHTKTEFQKSRHRTAYIWCHRNNELNNSFIFGHMQKASGGFDVKKQAILYYLKVCDGKAYKIGITNRSVTERFNGTDLGNIEVLAITKFANGLDAKNEELRILKEYKNARYKGKKLLKDGNTELFSYDILNLDKGN